MAVIDDTIRKAMKNMSESQKRNALMEIHNRLGSKVSGFAGSGSHISGLTGSSLETALFNAMKRASTGNVGLGEGIATVLGGALGLAGVGSGLTNAAGSGSQGLVPSGGGSGINFGGLGDIGNTAIDIARTLGILNGSGGVPAVPGGLGGTPQFNGSGSSGNGMAGALPQLLGSNQIVMEPQQKTINSAPPGWVIVTMPDGSKKAVLKDVAKCLGLWKPRKKPPISASDWNKLKRANAVKKKAKRIAETADFVCRKSKR